MNETKTPEENRPVTVPDDPKEAAKLLLKLKRAKKFASLLGIAQKGGHVIAGVNLVTEGIRRGGRSCPDMVFISENASENSVKRVRNCCEYYKVPCHSIPLTGDAIGTAIGKTAIVSAVGITDHGLAEALVNLL